MAHISASEEAEDRCALIPRAVGFLPVISKAFHFKQPVGTCQCENSWDGVPSGLVTGLFPPYNPLYGLVWANRRVKRRSAPIPRAVSGPSVTSERFPLPITYGDPAV